MRVAIRTDASVEIGSGHVMRCLALADELRRQGHDILFICRALPGHLGPEIIARGFELHLLPAPKPSTGGKKLTSYAAWLAVTQAQDAAETQAVLANIGDPAWWVVDHYGLDRRWESRVRGRSARMLVIDDLANRAHAADVLVDSSQGPLQAVSRYAKKVPSACRLLEGPRFALLHKAFASTSQRRYRSEVRRILVFFGGSDPLNVTGTALQALLACKFVDVQIDVVAGRANPHLQRLDSFCRRHDGFHLYTQVRSLAPFIKRADLALGAGGVAMWERCSLGLPSIVVACAENQLQGCRSAADAGAILYLGRHELVAPALWTHSVQVLTSAFALRQCIGKAARELIDGQGTRRTVQAMLPISLSLRRATAADCRSIYTWRNATSTRAFALDSTSISYATHARWYAKTITDPQRVLLIAEAQGEAIGVLRYDRDGEQALVSVYLVPGRAGQGLGYALLTAGSAWLKQHWPDVAHLEAVIQPENVASIRTFTAAGFRLHTSTYRFAWAT